jgi:hypothetical protein
MFLGRKLTFFHVLEPKIKKKKNQIKKPKLSFHYPTHFYMYIFGDVSHIYFLVLIRWVYNHKTDRWTTCPR